MNIPKIIVYVRLEVQDENLQLIYLQKQKHEIFFEMLCGLMKQNFLT